MTRDEDFANAELEMLLAAVDVCRSAIRALDAITRTSELQADAINLFLETRPPTPFG